LQAVVLSIVILERSEGSSRSTLLDTPGGRPYSFTREQVHSGDEEFEPPMDIRKTVTIIDDTLMDGGQASQQPLRRVAVIAVVRNPLVENNDEDLARLVAEGEDIGRFLARRALEQIDRRRVTMIGKAAIIGMDGEPEHGQAILFPKFAAAVREVMDASAARMFGEKKIAPAGSPIVVVLQEIDGRSIEPAGSFEIRVPESPRPDEILVALVVAGTGGSA
jgi:hypothetical protein